MKQSLIRIGKLAILSTFLGIAAELVKMVDDSRTREKEKAELKEEILKELKEERE